MMRLLIVVATLGLAHVAESWYEGRFSGHHHGGYENERQPWSGRNSFEGPRVSGYDGNHRFGDHFGSGGHRKPNFGHHGDQQRVPAVTTVKPVSGNGRDNEGVETKTLDQLYTDALKEGCKVIVYAGGDTPGQQDYYKNLFEQRFKNCTLDVIVDYSKFHAPRINMQLEKSMKSCPRLVPDVVQIQTFQDFPRWKKEGVLMRYKPRGWDAIRNDYKDPEGDFVGIFIAFFTNCISRALMPDQSKWPREANDYLRPELKGHISFTYPNDDDAILYLLKLYIDKYGWEYLEKLNTQNVTWVRGTQEPQDAVEQNRAWASPGAACDMHNDPGVPSVVVLPKIDPFMTWVHTAAIFKDAMNPATAKLYLNWILDKDTQTNYMGTWPVRSDVPVAGGFGPISNYRNQTNPTDFNTFMMNRALVEELKARVSLIIGEPIGAPSAGYPGRCPIKALPHNQ